MRKDRENYTLLTFYKFVDVENPEQEVEDHLTFCRWIGMKGRIYIGTEWISATVTGNEWQIIAYKLYLANHALFNNPNDLDIKSNAVDGHKFPRMSVKLKEEIVVLWQKYTASEIEAAENRIGIDEFKDLLDNGNPDEYVVLDMRNDHEYRLWHFKNAVRANTLTFRELEDKIDEYKKDFWDKKIISYCTGGIRCEKSTVMMQRAGLKNTYQLDGWVVKYINSYNDGNWQWNLYVFDDRVSAQVGDSKTHTVVWECIHSWKKTDNCENCRYSPCNARLIVDREQHEKHLGFCSQECFDAWLQDLLIKDVDFDSVNYRKARLEMRDYPEKQEKIMQELSERLKKKIWDISFRNETSQKEEFVMD